MCGIAGMVIKGKLDEERIEEFIKSSDLMAHRGPDNRGVFREGNVILIHYRLSIIDFDKRSNQPFFSNDNKLVCVYNGEIYNYTDLARKYMIAQRTTSDTEIMIESFNLYGEKIIPKWNGIFSLVIYNRNEKKLNIIRDRLGIKPLYIYEDKNVFLFASESKVILDWLNDFELNLAGLSQYMWFGNTTGTDTIIKNLNKVEPGTVTTFDINSNRIISNYKYWLIQKSVEKKKYTEKQAILKLNNLLERAVERQLVSDAPIGVLLSGGIDSSAIVANASKYYQGKLDTYTAFYDYNSSSKTDLLRARKISKMFNTNHHELEINGSDIIDIFKKLVFQYDEPFGDAANIPLYQLSNLCSNDKRVILQGDGGDELFAGYRRYNVINSLLFWRLTSYSYPFLINKHWKQRMKRTNFILNQSSYSNLMAYYLSSEVPSKNPYQIFNKFFERKLHLENWKKDYENANLIFGKENKIQRLLYTDTKILLPNTYLEKVDKATMYASIEARVPFLDNELVDFSLSLSSDLKIKKNQKKYLLKKALEGTIPSEILYGPKKGFDAPYYEWLRKDLYSFAKDIFSKANQDIFDSKKCFKLLEDHKAGKEGIGSLLWKTLVLAYWVSIYEKKGKLKR